MGTKNNIIGAVLVGLGMGLATATGITTGVLANRKIDDYIIRSWFENSEKKNPVVIKSDYKQPDKGMFICMFQGKKIDRKIGLYTDSLGTCCALAIDDRKEGTHYLAHFTAWDTKDEIANSVTSNFPSLNGLEFTVVGGTYSPSLAARNVYNALKSMEVLNRTKYTQSDRIMIKEGNFYYPVSDIRK
jgi:hypothetical protein